jgi:eukaryotic-like serine/threonine-protein kinase
MTLASGTKIGPYEVQSQLGAGGMGEVYRARDTRLDRIVAVKILPPHLSGRPDARERFDREARAISSLSHPNICHLYDVGTQNETSYLVMEYLEGETLADRLRKGRLPLEQLLKCGIEICEGLEKAHHSGVVHRDLKPGNIMLTKSGAKLMDFGLAKPAVAAMGVGSSSASLATLSQPLTAEGMVVGTFQYMSPEQVEGKEADARSDIFALGAVLYEMVTGKRAFEGKTPASTIAAILAGEPKPISTIQPLASPALEAVVKECLAKDPDERLQTAHDVKLQLKWIAESDSKFGVPARAMGRRKSWDRAGWLLAALLVLLIIGGGVTWWISAHQASRAMYFSSAFPLPANDVALSKDGRMVAMVAYSDQANKYMIWTHDVGGRRATTVPGTEEASHPFWSPDGRFIGFFAQGKLKKVDVFSGRSPQVLCDAPHGRGGTWNRGGVILFSPEGFGGLYRVSSAGGTPTPVTQVEASRSEFSHRWPVFLPDGRHYLYLAANFSGKLEKNEIFLGSLDSSERQPIVSASSNAVYADPGYLLYMRDNALVAQRFDSRSYVLSGEPHTVSDEVQYFPIIDLAVFDVAGKGSLAVQTGKGADNSQLIWFDRNGRQVGAVGKPAVFANPAMSPDGRRVVVDQTDSNGRYVNIWIHELANEAATHLTFSSAADQLSIWSPDGKHIVFGSNQKFHFTLYQKNSDGSGSEQEIADLGAQEQGPWDWSHDGKYLLAMKNAELWYLSVPNWQAKPFLQAKWTFRNAQFSPDGRWVAYSTNETGNWEVYVSPFPNASSKWQVSRGGGEEPRWRRDGKELFYLSGEGKMMAVPVKTGTSFEAGPPVTLFQTHTRQPISVMDVFSYDVTGDGQKFLINTKVDEPNAAPLSIILNWASEMEK